MTATHSQTFIPAAGRHTPVALYDRITWLFRIDPLRDELLSHADLQPGERVLDVGCGTGTLAVTLKLRDRTIEVSGVDPDASILARARRKAARAGVEVRLDQAFADALPYDDASFDRVFSSFMFHHLDRANKEKMLREVVRVLRPGGRFDLLDFGGPEHRDRGLLTRVLHSNRLIRDNAETTILALLEDAGFSGAARVSEGRFLLGTAVCFRATKPR